MDTSVNQCCCLPQAIPVAPWCCSVSPTSVSTSAVSYRGALDVRRPTSLAFIPASRNSGTGSTRSCSSRSRPGPTLSECLARLPHTASESNSDSDSCSGYGGIPWSIRSAITRATIPVATIYLHLPAQQPLTRHFHCRNRNLTLSVA